MWMWLAIHYHFILTKKKYIFYKLTIDETNASANNMFLQTNIFI